MFPYLVAAAVAAYATYYGLSKFFRGTAREDDIEAGPPPQIPSHPQSHRSFSPQVDQQGFNYYQTHQVQTDAQTYLRVVSERNLRLDQSPRTPVPPHDGREEWQSQSFNSLKEFDALSGNGVCGVCARASASEEHKSTKKYYQDNCQTYKDGDHLRAKQLSMQGAHHKQETERPSPQIPIYPQSYRSYSPPVDQQHINHSQTYLRVIPEQNPQLDQSPQTPVPPRDEREEWRSQRLNSFKEFDALPGNGVPDVHASAEHELMTKYYQDDRQAYEDGDHLHAKQPSMQGFYHEPEMKRPPPQIPSRSGSHRSLSPPVDQQRSNCSQIDQAQTDAQTYLPVIPERNPQLNEIPRTPFSPRNEREEWQSQDFDSIEAFDAPIPGNGVCGVCACSVCARVSANKENKSIKKRRRNSRRAHKAGDHPRVKQPSRQDIQHKQQRERRRAKAGAAILEENKVRAPFVDLHGLRVKEAIARAKITITDAVGRADPQVRLIVGQGKHSKGGIPRLKPEVQKAMQLLGYRVCVDPKNAGALIVELD